MLVRIASLYDITVDDLLDRKQTTTEDRGHVMVDKQRLLDYIKAEIKKKNEYIEFVGVIPYEHRDETMDMVAFATGEETALIRLLSAIEHGKFDEEAQHDA
jgi:hypothetical protein